MPNKTDKKIPNPGSDEARAMGCKCPVIDNGHGRRADGRFVISGNCPLHYNSEYIKEMEEYTNAV